MKTDREKPDFKTMSEAVQAWYRFYELDLKQAFRMSSVRQRSISIRPDIARPTISRQLSLAPMSASTPRG